MAATIDKDLTTTLKAARGGKPMRFAFLPKGGEGKLLVGKKIPPQQIAETKKATGASSVLKGRCVGEEGTLVFYVVKEPPGTLLGQLKKRLKEDAGLTCPIEVRVSADAEDELPEGEAEAAGAAEAAPGTPESPRAGWEKALAEVEPAYLQALRDQPDKASALRAVMGFAQAKAAKEDFPGAIAALQKLAEQLAMAPAGRGAKATPGPEPVNLAGGDLAAQWKKNLAAWTPAIKAALAAKGPNAVAIAKLLAQATALSKPGGDLAQALDKLTECHALATGRTADGEASAGEPVAETAPPTEGQAEPQTAPQPPTARPEGASSSPPPTEQQAPTDEAALQAEYERRVLALEPKVLEAEKTRKGQAKWLTLFMSAQDLGSEGDFAKAQRSHRRRNHCQHRASTSCTASSWRPRHRRPRKVMRACSSRRGSSARKRAWSWSIDRALRGRVEALSGDLPGRDRPPPRGAVVCIHNRPRDARGRPRNRDAESLKREPLPAPPAWRAGIEGGRRNGQLDPFSPSPGSRRPRRRSARGPGRRGR
jgi:hypothetical protein